MLRRGTGAPAGRARLPGLELVVRRGVALTAIGVVLGLTVAAVASRLVRRLMIGVSPLDPLTYAGAAALLLVVAALASWFPARRATRVDPVEVLRTE